MGGSVPAMKIGHWVDGRAVEGSSGRTAPVFDPAAGTQTAEVALASAAEVDAAVAVAVRAAGDWGSSSLSTRTNLLFRLRELLAAGRDELAAAVTREHGKVLDDAQGEVARGLENVEFACGIPHLLKGAAASEVSTGVDIRTMLQPVGVVAGITPFNFPVMVPLWMMANAIACGNTFVLKPSEKDPSPSLILADMVRRAGFPDGVVNVVQGDSEAVDALLTHPAIGAVSFVGSTGVARHVYETGTRHGKRVQALGGAKNHMVVLPDADLAGAADAAISAGYGSAGERCMAISMLVAVGSVADDLVDAIASRIPGVVVGPGNDPASMMGPLITSEHRDRVRGLRGARGRRRGAGRRRRVGRSPPGRLLPGLLTPRRREAGDAGLRRRDLRSGPGRRPGSEPRRRDRVGERQPVRKRDGDLHPRWGAARRFEREIQVGMVGINVPIPVPVASHSFGGWKDSLFGDAAIYGPEGIRFYTRPKVVTSRWPEPDTSRIDLGFPTTH